MRILYDPIEALFDGVTSTFSRVLLAIVAFLLGFGTFYMSQEGSDLRALSAFPMVALFIIFVWATKGMLFFVGLASIIGFIFVSWRFLDSVQPKLLFISLYLTAVVYFIPLTWNNDFVIWRAILSVFAVLTFYVTLAFALPLIARRLTTRNAV